MEFLEGSVKLLSEKLTEETIASNQNLRFPSVKLICICSREANVLNSMALHFLNFDSFKYISLLYREWKLIWNKVYFKFLSFVHLLLKKIGFWSEQTEDICWDLRCTCYLIRIFSQRVYLFTFSRCFELFWRFQQWQSFWK